MATTLDRSRSLLNLISRQISFDHVSVFLRVTSSYKPFQAPDNFNLLFLKNLSKIGAYLNIFTADKYNKCRLAMLGKGTK